MPAGNGKMAEKTNRRLLNIMRAIKKSVVVVKKAFLCLANALIMAMARVNGDPKCALNRDGKCLKKVLKIS